MAEIEYEIIGHPNFLRDSLYGAYLLDDMRKLEDQFLLAKNINIKFTQEINLDPNKIILNKLEISEDGNEISLIYITCFYNIGKGKLSDPPSPSGFFDGFKYYMVNTVIKGDNGRFEELNNNQEEK